MVELDRPTINDETVEDLVAFLYALSSDRLVARLAAAEGDSKEGVERVRLQLAGDEPEAAAVR
jgi:hypothetical protein